jgi:DNA-binding NtrC family response regulator
MNDPNATEPELRVYDLDHPEADLPKPRQLLMLEDEGDYAQILRTFLESGSFIVTTAPNGADGLRHIMARDFDVILCDMLMPQLPGDKFYLAVERTKPHLCSRFLFMTGYGADPRWNEFIRKINGRMLCKPFQMPELLKALREVLARNSPPPVKKD